MTTPQEPGGRDPHHIPPPPPLTESELQGATGQAGPPPKEVQWSFWLWLAGAALSVISALLLFGQRDVFLGEIRKQPDAASLSDAQLDTLVTASIVFGVVISLVFAGLYLLFAFKAKAGRNWARIVLAILTGLSVISTFSGGTGGISVLAVVSTLIAIAAAVLLFLPASNPYFASAQRSK